MFDILRGISGMAVFMVIAWALSVNRKRIDWRLIAGGLIMQIVLAVIFLKFRGPVLTIEWVAKGVVQLLAFSQEGGTFVFGDLVANAESTGAVFAFRVLPSIIFFSAISAILFYMGVLPRVIRAFAWLMKKLMRISGAESFAVAANIFVGQVEAPLMVRPYIGKMTKSELCALMTGGMATIAGGVLVAYISFLGGGDPVKNVLFARHLITASILSAPAAILFAKLLVPETEEFQKNFKVEKEKLGANLFDAATRGTAQGLQLALIIAAILIVFTSLIPFINALLSGTLGGWTGLNHWIYEISDHAYSTLSLEWMFGWLFSPVAWLMGIDPSELLNAGRLLGEKLVLNEFVAYVNMGHAIQAGAMVDEKSIVIMTYALCGFANFASIGIQIAGISTLAPERREDLSRLAPRAVLGGTFACLMTGCLAGIMF
jgi:concentrative nucleoside transporter, CNT family